jgi:hypothetical protein
MAHSAARSDDFSDSYYRGGESLSQNETTPYPYFFGREPENGPPHHNMPVVTVFRTLVHPSRALTSLLRVCLLSVPAALSAPPHGAGRLICTRGFRDCLGTAFRATLGPTRSTMHRSRPLQWQVPPFPTLSALSQG